MPVLSLSRDQFRARAAQGNLVPLYAEILADLETPVSAYLKLRGTGPCFLLESVEQGERYARYSFVGVNPRVTFRFHGGKVTLHESGVAREVASSGDPLADLQALMAPYRPAGAFPDLPPFFGGAVGMLGYEAVRSFEPSVPAAKADDLGLPEAVFLITGSVLVFDHLARKLKVVVNALVDGDIDAAYDAAAAEIAQLIDKLRVPLVPRVFDCAVPSDLPDVQANMTHDFYVDMTARMQEYIRAGDIFQVVPSQRFEVPFTAPPIDLYRALRMINPSPYMFCLEFGDFSLVGSSPEIHVRCMNGKVELRPIAGTRRRGATPEEDLAAEQDLLADPKERAEHVMLVDLGRNDVGRVCEFNTVRVPEFMIIERYSHVMHIVSHVEGKLRADQNAYDVMRATFPAGTVTGSPKIRAMQIIAEQEPTRRGSYAGAVGYFGFNGELDSCIAIRTVLLKDGRAYLQAGGGLVADSTPEGEYQESVSKSRAGRAAIAVALAQTA